MDQLIERKLKSAAAKAFTDKQIASSGTLTAQIKKLFDLSESDPVELRQTNEGEYYFPLDSVHALMLWETTPYIALFVVIKGKKRRLAENAATLPAIAECIERYQRMNIFSRWLYRIDG